MEKIWPKISQDEMDKVNVDLAAAAVSPLKNATICPLSPI